MGSVPHESWFGIDIRYRMGRVGIKECDPKENTVTRANDKFRMTGTNFRRSTQRSRSGNRSPVENKRRGEVAVKSIRPIECGESCSRNTLEGPGGHV